MSEEQTWCTDFGPCCMISRYEVVINTATFHVGEDFISLVSIIELLFLLAVLFYSYVKLDRSHSKNFQDSIYILPVYFAFVLLLTIWYSVAVLLILIPDINDSFIISILYDGHGTYILSID